MKKSCNGWKTYFGKKAQDNDLYFKKKTVCKKSSISTQKYKFKIKGRKFCRLKHCLGLSFVLFPYLVQYKIEGKSKGEKFRIITCISKKKLNARKVLNKHKTISFKPKGESFVYIFISVLSHNLVQYKIKGKSDDRPTLHGFNCLLN